MVNKEIVPEVINIVAVEDNSEVKIDLEYKSVSLNEDIRFPFEIPSGYKEIRLK
jgi:3-isopropylmalate dehydratase small subunit